MNEEENAYNDWLAKQDKSRDTYNILERLGQVALDYAKAEREIERLRAENAELNETLKKYELHNVGLVRELDELAAHLDAQGQHPGFPQPPAGGDDDEPAAGTA